MNCDACIVTGKSHRMCQDYVRYNRTYHRTDKLGNPIPPSSQPYVVLADGCSDTKLWMPPYGNDTDWGARILCQMAERFLFTDPAKFYDNVLFNAVSALSVLGLQPNALDATLLTAAVVESDGKLVVRCTSYGDGFVVAKHRDGSHGIFKTSFAKYPYYLSYNLDKQRLAEMLAACGGKNQRQVDVTTVHPTGSWAKHPPQLFDDPAGVMEFPCDEYEFVAIMSDGAESFYRLTDRGSEAHDLVKVMTGLMAFFPSFEGEFVQRTTNGFLKRSAKEGFMHSDDLSVAVIYTGN